jgi:hypothetical protein
MLRRNCILEEIAATGDGLHRHRCLICGRQCRSRYASDRVHVMCVGTPEEHAAWRAVAAQRLLDELYELADPAGADGGRRRAEDPSSFILHPSSFPVRSYEEMEALYAQCQCCPDWEVALCRRLRCPGRPQKYLRLLADPGQRCPNWRPG